MKSEELTSLTVQVMLNPLYQGPLKDELLLNPLQTILMLEKQAQKACGKKPEVQGDVDIELPIGYPLGR